MEKSQASEKAEYMSTERLRVISVTEHFKSCIDCRFVYMPMTFDAETHCPKCSPIHLRIDPEMVDDELYIENEKLRQNDID